MIGLSERTKEKRKMKKNRKIKTMSIVTDYAHEQAWQAKEQNESIALVCLIRSIHIYKHVKAPAEKYAELIHDVMDTFGIDEFTALDAEIITSALCK